MAQPGGPTRSLKFDNGSIAIILDKTLPGNYLQVHKNVLDRSSTWFAEKCSETPIQLEPFADGKIPFAKEVKFLFALDFQMPLAEDQIPMLPLLIPMEIKKRGNDKPSSTHPKSKPADSTNTSKRKRDANDGVSAESTTQGQTESGKIKDEADKLKESLVREAYAQSAVAHESLLRCYYNQRPRIPSKDIITALGRSEALIAISQHYGSLNIVRPRVRDILMEYDQILPAAILKDPARWLHLATQLQSKRIFREAFVHIVGCWPTWPWMAPMATFDATILDMIKAKASVLKEMRRDANDEILKCTIFFGEPPREKPIQLKDDKETWFVVQIFRDWFATQYAAVCDIGHDNNQVDPRKIGVIYRALSKGGDTYLKPEQVYHMLSEISAKADLAEVTEDLRLLKNCASELVHSLCVNNLNVSPEDALIGYLTCTEVDEEDYPWANAGDEVD